MPPYININHDTEAKLVELSIQDASKKNQKEMWGMSRSHTGSLLPLQAKQGLREKELTSA